MWELARYDHPGGFAPPEAPFAMDETTLIRLASSSCEANDTRLFRFSHEGLSNGDTSAPREGAPCLGLLFSTAGFCRYVFETEMLIDLCKAESAAQWLDALLVRLARRTRMESETFCVLCCMQITPDTEVK